MEVRVKRAGRRACFRVSILWVACFCRRMPALNRVNRVSQKGVEESRGMSLPGEAQVRVGRLTVLLCGVTRLGCFHVEPRSVQAFTWAYLRGLQGTKRRFNLGNFNRCDSPVMHVSTHSKKVSYSDKLSLRGDYTEAWVHAHLRDIYAERGDGLSRFPSSVGMDLVGFSNRPRQEKL